MTTMVAPSPRFHTPVNRRSPGDSGLMIWGMIPLEIKVSTADTNGAFFMFQHTDMSPGGPPRHLHHNQDEWFHVLRGEFIFDIGGKTARLTDGDSLFAPRGVPHAWACAGDTPGTILTMLSPAGSFETFIRETAKELTLPPPDKIAEAFAAHDMQVLGPPLDWERLTGPFRWRFRAAADARGNAPTASARSRHSVISSRPTSRR